MTFYDNRQLPEHRKRIRSPSLNSLRRQKRDYKRREGQFGLNVADGERLADEGMTERKEHESFAREQTRLNQIQEAERMRQWVSQEDDFVLKQSKKKAQIRVREGRAKPIDWLSVTLSVIDSTRDPLEDDGIESDAEIVDPAGIFEGMSHSQLQDLGKEIDSYLILESNGKNRDYWNVGIPFWLPTYFSRTDGIQALKVICKDHQNSLAPSGTQARAGNAVSADVERLLGLKTFEELSVLESQISAKLQSNEPIDVEYWEQLLRNIAVYKAKAELNKVYKSIIESRLNNLRQEQAVEAEHAKEKLALLLAGSPILSSHTPRNSAEVDHFPAPVPILQYSRRIDPEPHLKLRAEDKGADIFEEVDFMSRIVSIHVNK